MTPTPLKDVAPANMPVFLPVPIVALILTPPIGPLPYLRVALLPASISSTGHVLFSW